MERLGRLAALVVACSAGRGAAAGGGDESILHPNSTWRSHIVLRPARTSPKLWKTVELPAAGSQGKRWARWAQAGLACSGYDHND